MQHLLPCVDVVQAWLCHTTYMLLCVVRLTPLPPTYVAMPTTICTTCLLTYHPHHGPTTSPTLPPAFSLLPPFLFSLHACLPTTTCLPAFPLIPTTSSHGFLPILPTPCLPWLPYWLWHIVAGVAFPYLPAYHLPPLAPFPRLVWTAGGGMWWGAPAWTHYPSMPPSLLLWFGGWALLPALACNLPVALCRLEQTGLPTTYRRWGLGPEEAGTPCGPFSPGRQTG